MFEKLTWDSDFFGYNVGKLTLEADAVPYEYVPPDGFKLVYIFSKKEISISNATKIDERVDFIKQPQIHNISEKIVRFDSSLHSYEELFELAKQCGECSRFRLDKKFQNNEFERLYKIWIDNAIDSDHNDTFVVVRNNHLAGFITLERKATYGRLGLMAVDLPFRGQGIAWQLMRYGENRCAELGFPTLHLTTQFANKPAMNLYTKLGFTLISKTHIYHYWNQ